MKRIGLLFLSAFLCQPIMSAQVSFGEPSKIDSDWKFTLTDPHDAQSPQFDDSKWQNIALPHDWSIKGQMSPTLASCTGYLPGGVGWYRKTLEVPAQKRGEKVYLYFEGVYHRSSVYVNGQLLGHRPNGYISFMYDATPYIKCGEKNVIAVRVDHSRYADSRWYTGSGIYRDVWLIYASPLHIAQWGVYASPKEASVKQGVLSVSVTISNETSETADVTVENELLAPGGKRVAKNTSKLRIEAGAENTVTEEIRLSHPHLWDLEHPTLYILKTTLLQGKKVIDQTETATGFRSFAFDPDKGFALNGKWVKMKGVCLHHDAGVLGSAVPREVWKRRLENLKKIGCNAIRTSHNPQAPCLYDLCDALGLLVIDEAFDEWEFAKRKWIHGWNKDTPLFDGSFDFFEEWGERDMADIVRRDRNHISIFGWSIGNEVDYPNDPYSHPVLDGNREGGFTQPIFGGYKKDAPDALRLGAIAKRLAAAVKKYDLSRPVTAGLAGVAMSNETEYPDVLDIAGYNYTENRYISDHAKYPKRVIYGSENRHERDAWMHVVNNEHIFGQFLWTGIDYLGESGPWPSRGFYSGLLDFKGDIKPRGYFRQSLWSALPMAYIGTYPSPLDGGSNMNADVLSATEAQKGKGETKPSMDAWPVWNYDDGQLIRVVCYTNAPKARLLLNGRQTGDTKEYDTKLGIIVWDIPYQAGILQAEGLDENNKVVSTYRIRTSGRPCALTASADKSMITALKGVVQISISVVDKDNIPVMLSDDNVTIEISGPGKLLGLESGSNSDTGDWTDNVQRVFLGSMLAYVQATGKGAINIKLTAQWLKPTEIAVTAE